MTATPKLDEFIDAEGKSMLAEALAEIREHLQRIPVPQATRYPSEAETRLIELCTEMIADLTQVESPMVVDAHKRILAAIKRDLCLEPSP